MRLCRAVDPEHSSGIAQTHVLENVGHCQTVALSTKVGNELHRQHGISTEAEEVVVEIDLLFGEPQNHRPSRAQNASRSTKFRKLIVVGPRLL